MPRTVSPVDLTRLATWPTHRLLALRKRLLALEDSLELSDAEDPDEVDPTRIRFKDDPRWVAHMARLKALLAEREHVPSPKSGTAKPTDGGPAPRFRRPRPKPPRR